MGLVDTIKTAAEAVRVMQDVAGSAANAEQNKKMGEAYKAVLDAYREAIELQDENSKLKRELESFDDKRRLRAALKRDTDVYYFEETTEGFHTGPYCSQCFDADGKLITLKRTNTQKTYQDWYCGMCKNFYSSSLARLPK
jgi:hypothetical protein